jgi:hypothetical protein
VNISGFIRVERVRQSPMCVNVRGSRASLFPERGPGLSPGF